MAVRGVRVSRVAPHHLRQRAPLLRTCGGRERVLRGCVYPSTPLAPFVPLWALCVALGASCRRGCISAPPQPLRLPWLILCPSAVSLVGWLLPWLSVALDLIKTTLVVSFYTRTRVCTNLGDLSANEKHLSVSGVHLLVLSDHE